MASFFLIKVTDVLSQKKKKKSAQTLSMMWWVAQKMMINVDNIVFVGISKSTEAALVAVDWTSRCELESNWHRDWLSS